MKSGDTIKPRPHVLGGFEEPIAWEPSRWFLRVCVVAAIALSIVGAYCAVAGALWVASWVSAPMLNLAGG